MKEAITEIEQAATVSELTALLKRFRSLKYERRFITALLAKKSAIEKADTRATPQVEIDFGPPDDLGVETHGAKIIKMVNRYPVGLRDEDLNIEPDPVEAARLKLVKQAYRDRMLGMFGPNWRENYDNSTEG